MNERKFFIDTNVFLRLIAKDHPSQMKECVKFFDRLASGSFEAMTSTLVLAEIQWTLEKFYHVSKEEILRALFSIHSIPHLSIIEGSQAGVALSLYEKFSVKFIDTLIASHTLIQQKKMTIVSYDKEFDKLGVLRKQPADVL